MQTQGHVLDGADIGRDVLARRAVAARSGAYERAVLVGECNAAAIDFELAHELGQLAERVDHAVHPRVELFDVHRVIERVHATFMTHRGELLSHRSADALRGRIRIEEHGVLCFELAQFVHERVECAVRDLGCILHVIQINVMVDFLTQRLDALACIIIEQAQRFVHATLSRSKRHIGTRYQCVTNVFVPNEPLLTVKATHCRFGWPGELQ